MLLSQGNEAFYWRSVSQPNSSPLAEKQPVREGGLGAAYSCTFQSPGHGVGYALLARFLVQL